LLLYLFFVADMTKRVRLFSCSFF